MSVIFWQLGPNQIIPTSNITTTDPDGAVKLRSVESKDSEIEPESIPGLLARIASLYPDQPALGYKTDPKQKGFHIITYRYLVNNHHYYDFVAKK